MAVPLAELSKPTLRLNVTVFVASVASKFAPATITGVPGVPMVGLNPVMTGTPGAAITVKGVPLEVEPLGAATVIGPVAAPDGTLVTIRVAVAETTAAGTPLNMTVFSPGVSLNPVP